MKGGDEHDGLTKARKFYSWSKGQLKKIKRGYNKRLRKTGKNLNEDS
jgi:hypothetical protein